MCPAVEDAYHNRVLVNAGDSLISSRHLQVINDRSQRFTFTVQPCTETPVGSIGLNYLMRRQLQVTHNRRVSVMPYSFDLQQCCIGKLVLSVDFLHDLDRQNIAEVSSLNVEEMAKEFAARFPEQAFWKGQKLAFRFQGNKTLKLEVLQIEETFSYRPIETGLCVPKTRIVFQQAADSLLKLTRVIKTAINFEASNIDSSGFKQEFIATARRAFTAGGFSDELISGSGVRSIRGLLLYGPQGSFKSSAAMLFAKMLFPVEVRMINCETETATLEQLHLKPADLGLRVVIFNQIDSACQSSASQFYRLLDSLLSLRNILVIGITGNVAAIPVNLLGPGRLEFQLELTLPAVHGRVEIHHMATQRMEVFQLLDGSDMEPSQWHYLVFTFLIVTCGTWELLEVVTQRAPLQRVVSTRKQDYAMFSAIGPREHVWE